MHVLALILLLALFAVQALYVGWVSEDRLSKRVESFEKRNVAWIDPGMLPAFNSFTRLASYTLGACMMLSGVVATVLVVTHRDSDAQIGLVLPLAMAVFVPVWSAYRLVVAGREFPLRPGLPVVARPRRVSAGDYVPVRVRLLMFLDVAGLAVFSTLIAVHPDWVLSYVRVPVFVALALTLVGAAALPFIERVTCERPQAAPDESTLYVLDAWRAESLRSAYGAVSVLALEVVFAAAVTSGRPGWFVGGLVGMIAIGWLHGLALKGSLLHFRRRLWPTLGPGQVLLYGDVAPARTVVAA